MHLRWRTDHALDDVKRAEPGECGHHLWRIRDVTFALPGAYVCEVCERCGAMHLDGPDELTGRLGDGAPGEGGATAPDDPDSNLDSFARRWSPRDKSPPTPPNATR